MPIYISRDNSELLYIHIPKAAGSSVERVLSENTKYEYLFSTSPGEHLCTPQHFHNSMLTVLLNDREVDNFTIVRNPFVRLLSEFKYEVSRGLFDTDTFSFDHFVFDRLQQFSKDNYIYDNHFRPMVEFLLPNTTVFKLEDGENLIEEYLSKFINKKVYLPKENTSQTFKVVSISLETIDIILQTYHEDFERFGYDVKIEGLVMQGVFEISQGKVQGLDARKLASEIKACAPKLTEKEIDLLRDSAVILEKLGRIKAAMPLMALAQKYRPEGAFINAKVLLYKDSLDSKVDL